MADVWTVSHPFDTVDENFGTEKLRYRTLNVGSSTNDPVGEYSIRMTPSCSTWKRALPEVTVAFARATAAAASM